MKSHALKLFIISISYRVSIESDVKHNICEMKGLMPCFCFFLILCTGEVATFPNFLRSDKQSLCFQCSVGQYRRDFRCRESLAVSKMLFCKNDKWPRGFYDSFATC